METTLESSDILNGNMKTIINEYKQRIFGAINKETAGIREDAEHELRNIILRTLQESEEAYLRAKEDAAKILSEANLRAKEIIKEAEQQHDSMIAESKKGVERILNVINNINENLGSAVNDAKQMKLENTTRTNEEGVEEEPNSEKKSAQVLDIKEYLPG